MIVPQWHLGWFLEFDGRMFPVPLNSLRSRSFTEDIRKESTGDLLRSYAEHSISCNVVVTPQGCASCPHEVSIQHFAALLLPIAMLLVSLWF